MKINNQEYNDAARFLKKSSVLIILSLFMLVVMPILMYLEIIGGPSIISIFIFLYILKKQCWEYETTKIYMDMFEEMEGEGENS
ncbi:MAG: hypothetical protein QNK75_05210 [Crocinitomicaceae bacterium]